MEHDLGAWNVRVLGPLRQNPDGAHPRHEVLDALDRVVDFAIIRVVAR